MKHDSLLVCRERRISHQAIFTGTKHLCSYMLRLFPYQLRYLKNAILNPDIVVGPALVKKTSGNCQLRKPSLHIQVS